MVGTMEGVSTSFEGEGVFFAQQRKNEHGRSLEEASISCSPSHKQSILLLKDKVGRNKGKRKKGRGSCEGGRVVLFEWSDGNYRKECLLPRRWPASSTAASHEAHVLELS